MRVTKYKTKLSDNRRAVLEKEFSVNYPELERKMSSPERVAKLAREVLRMHEHAEEYMYLVCTNTKLELMSVFEVSHGNVNSSVAGVREIFQKALLANAVCIFIMHNHPSGDPTPSSEDIKVTERVVKTGEILGVQVLDHIIIGKSSYTSLKEKGYI